jgi:hypothetical protein
VYRLSQIPYLVDQGQLPNWVREQLATKLAEIQETLEFNRRVTLRGPNRESVVIMRG